MAISGTLRDARRQPVPFASVGVVGTALGATADEAGRFELTRAPAGPVRLRASWGTSPPSGRYMNSSKISNLP
ncbi:carboxypeptidase-like regulatory domain-containing protein [Hymenobacter rubidus]|uniref:carboxypeptidase-like regulatory domain-containing protein n=1 Tax=Hymenobacter rubidus TaxID=1441626 RepID=UPI00191ED005|nr:carboxypeptidase-like regulatory domain-containing protein [Hymenobacter rubidus]